MILRSTQCEIFFLLFFTLGNGALQAKADTTFECNTVALSNTKFDLTSLAGEQVVNRTRETPPTIMLDYLRFNLCDDLKEQSVAHESDQCPLGSRACLTKINQKVDHPDLVIAVISIAQTSLLEPILSANSEPKSLSLLFHGPNYPPNPPSNPQSLNLTLLCDPAGISDPKFVAYDGSRLDVEWSAPAGCPLEGEDGDHKDQDDEKGDPSQEAVGSGIGWFFLVLLLAFLAYFGLGAYYNYSTYGATGLDLIPHRDFWKEVPYMFNDVVSHLCSNVRSRRTSTRGGYISV